MGDPVQAPDIEADVVALARRLAELGGDEQSRVYHLSFWSERLIEWAMAHPQFKTQLFRLVDVYPACRDDADVVRHVEEYFAGVDVPRTLGFGLDAADHVPFGRQVTASVVRRNISRMARQFIAGTTPAEAARVLGALWAEGSAATVDLLGEKTLTLPEADRYAARVDELLDVLSTAAAAWPANPMLEADDLGPLPRVNVSVKPTALAPRLAPLTAEAGLREAKDRLRPLVAKARDLGALITLDMEHHAVKSLTLRLARELLDEDAFAHVGLGVVIQAYLHESYDDLRDVIAWSSSRATPLTVRLVKGAYWDTETVIAAAHGWEPPVFVDKAATDASYERCVRLLHEHHGQVRAAFASHNLRSLSYAVCTARAMGIPDDGYELQMLHGMAEPLHTAVRRLGVRLRVYAPVGELVPGMAYLVRRLLENTSNESFVRHRFAEGADLERLLQPPGRGERRPAPGRVRRGDTDPGNPGPYEPEPAAEWHRAEVRAEMAAAVAAAPARFGADVPAVIGGERVHTDERLPSLDPGDPSTVIATSAACTAAHADAAVAVARKAQSSWAKTPATERSAVLFRAAAWMRARRSELAADEVFEVGKPWAEADADVTEAIDFCEYYGREMIRLDGGGRVQSPPGEANSLVYDARGVGAVIAPWNFPLAIATGMTVAGLVAGNAVVLKPAEQSPLMAWRLVEALEDAGLPPGVLGFVPGSGERVGARLVEHPQVSFVVFTGSKDVGLEIIRRAAVAQPGQRQVKKVIAEMGGKNALIVDSDADLDTAVPAALASAFGFAGQKCSAASRLVVLAPVYEETIDRLVAAARLLVVGHPRDPAVTVGPVIDTDAHQRLTESVAAAGLQGRVVLGADNVPRSGYFVGPTIVADVPSGAPLARDELFGPVLAVQRARDLDHAIELANDTDYGLTAGIISRSPVNIARATEELRAGNVYVNRTITGAVVGRQPFGGRGLSGVGSKAGGPDYLLQMLEPRTVTENTLRQGFAPGSDHPHPEL